jgi:hypothetical protein
MSRFDKGLISLLSQRLHAGVQVIDLFVVDIAWKPIFFATPMVSFSQYLALVSVDCLQPWSPEKSLAEKKCISES